jgi:hypothetical protein
MDVAPPCNTVASDRILGDDPQIRMGDVAGSRKDWLEAGLLDDLDCVI